MPLFGLGNITVPQKSHFFILMFDSELTFKMQTETLHIDCSKKAFSSYLQYMK